MQNHDTIDRLITIFSALATATTLLVQTSRVLAQAPNPAEQLVPIEGKVLDDNDNPVAGVTVQARRCCAAELPSTRAGRLDDWSKGNCLLSYRPTSSAPASPDARAMGRCHNQFREHSAL
jgi:hypothetical protein